MQCTIFVNDPFCTAIYSFDLRGFPIVSAPTPCGENRDARGVGQIEERRAVSDERVVCRSVMEASLQALFEPAAR